jgi:hypothetical protein
MQNRPKKNNQQDTASQSSILVDREFRKRKQERGKPGQTREQSLPEDTGTVGVTEGGRVGERETKAREKLLLLGSFGILWQ